MRYRKSVGVMRCRLRGRDGSLPAVGGRWVRLRRLVPARARPERFSAAVEAGGGAEGVSGAFKACAEIGPFAMYAAILFVTCGVGLLAIRAENVGATAGDSGWRMLLMTGAAVCIGYGVALFVYVAGCPNAP